MINPNELRLGNFVKDRGGKTIKIDFIEYVRNGYDTKFGQLMYLEGEEVHPMTEYSDYAFPIPITEEWLLKFGFEKQNEWWFKNHKLSIEKWITKEGIDVRLRTSEESSVLITELQHVHQLQNLYFALTGEELTQVSEGEK